VEKKPFLCDAFGDHCRFRRTLRQISKFAPNSEARSLVWIEESMARCQIWAGVMGSYVHTITTSELLARGRKRGGRGGVLGVLQLRSGI
jgi:hypothetical protein